MKMITKTKKFTDTISSTNPDDVFLQQPQPTFSYPCTNTHKEYF